MFAEYIKNMRISHGFTLRDFCAKIGLDPSNWSKVERGINPPPGDIDTLNRIADHLKLGGPAKIDLLDKAALARREVPADLAENPLFLRLAPAFFRNTRGDFLSDMEMTEFLEELKRLNTPDKDHLS